MLKIVKANVVLTIKCSNTLYLGRLKAYTLLGDIVIYLILIK